MKPLDITTGTIARPALIRPENVIWLINDEQPHLLLGTGQYDQEHLENRHHHIGPDMYFGFNTDLDGSTSGVGYTNYVAVTKPKKRVKHFTVRLTGDLWDPGQSRCSPHLVPVTQVQGQNDERTMTWIRDRLARRVSDHLGEQFRRTRTNTNTAALLLLSEMGGQPFAPSGVSDGNLIYAFYRSLTDETRNLLFQLMLKYLAAKDPGNRGKVKQILEYQRMQSSTPEVSATTEALLEKWRNA